MNTLRIRFALWTAGLLVGAFILFGFFVYTSMSRDLTNAVDTSLRLATIPLTEDVLVRNGALVAIENPIGDPQYLQLQEHGFSIRILDPNGQLLQEFGHYGQLLQLPEGYHTSHQAGEYSTIRDPLTQDLVRVYTAPVTVGDRPIGVIQVAQNLLGVQATLWSLIITFLIAGPVIVLLASIGGYMLVARALDPIDAITRTARSISANDLSARLNPVHTDDEVGRLAATFDSMLTRLENSFRRERQFTADASHELRTPLSAIQTIIGGTLTRKRTAEEYEQSLSDLSGEVDRMRILTEGLLHLARHDQSLASSKIEPIDLSILLGDVIDSFRPIAEEKRLAIADQLPHTGLEIHGDSDGLIRLFVNLINNAVKYTEQGSIVISTRPATSSHVIVTIADTGIGIAPEHLPHIFDRFYRVDASRSKMGTGLGLAIALNIARAHGGTISAESEIGKGTTFVVLLSTDAAVVGGGANGQSEDAGDDQ